MGKQGASFGGKLGVTIASTGRWPGGQRERGRLRNIWGKDLVHVGVRGGSVADCVAQRCPQLYPPFGHVSYSGTLLFLPSRGEAQGPSLAFDGPYEVM